MAGQQHPFPPSFPNAQQNAMRNQFGGGQMVSGLMGPQQGMVNPQQFGGGMGSNVGPNSLGMLNPQQVMTQQQPMQQQLQQQQQMHLQQQQQQQQQQQAALVQQNNQMGGTQSAPQMPVAQNQQPQVQRPHNVATICRLGQEHVQEIVSRMQELFQILKMTQPPNGTNQGQNLSNEKRVKVHEHLKFVGALFKRLKYIYEKCNENCQLQGMEYTHIESLIPIKEEWDMKSEEKKASETYRLAYEEYRETMEQLVLKNRQLKEIIDLLRRIISEINTMMNMRRS